MRFAPGGPPRRGEGALLRGQRARLGTDGVDETLFDRADVSFPASTSPCDLLAAATAARLMGAPAEAIRRAVRAFRGVEHVLERVADIDGVAFYNDTKATNVDAARKSLEAFTRPGARPSSAAATRAATSPSLAPALRAPRQGRAGHRRGAGPRRAGAGCDAARRAAAASLREAVEQGCALATPGDTVLLAPACSSFDMFKDYAARGRAFKDEVRGGWPRGAAVAKKLTSDSSLFAVTVALLASGLVMVWSASSALAQERHGNAYHFLVRQVVWACLGPGRDGGRHAHRLPQAAAPGRRLLRGARHASCSSPCCSCAPVNDTHRWIRLGGAVLAARGDGQALDHPVPRLPPRAQGERINEFLPSLFPVVLLLGWFAFLIFIQPDLGSAAVIILVGGVMLYLAGVRLRYFAALAVLGLPSCTRPS